MARPSCWRRFAHWQFAANHHPRQAGRGFVTRNRLAGHLAAAQNGGAVAQGLDFVQLVADVDNRHALAGQPAQGVEQLLHRLRGEHRGGFVQDQQLGVLQQAAHDFHPLALAHRQAVHQPVRVQRQAVALGHFAHPQRQRRRVERRIQRQGDVLDHGQGFEQRKMLKHHANAQLARLRRVGDGHRLAVPADFASVGLDRAIDDFHQRAFARAIFAKNGVDLAGRHRQADAIIGDHAGVTLADPGQGQTGRGLRHAYSG